RGEHVDRERPVELALLGRELERRDQRLLRRGRLVGREEVARRAREPKSILGRRGRGGAELRARLREALARLEEQHEVVDDLLARTPGGALVERASKPALRR